MLTFTYVGPLEAVEVDEASGVRPGDTVDDHIHPAPSSESLHLSHPVGGPIVDNVVSSETLHEIDL